MKRALLTLLAALAFAAPAQAATIAVTTFDDGANAFCPSATQCSLRAAVALSKSNGGTNNDDTIVLQPGTYQLANAPLTTSTTNQGVTIVGAGADKTVIRAALNQRTFEVQGESAFTLRGLALAGGNAGTDANGGNVLVTSAEVRLDHVRLTGGRAVQGGGIAAQNGQVLADHTLIDNNVATQDGGGIASYNGSELSLLTSTLTGNSALRGGGISVSDQQTIATTIALSTLALNTSNAAPGGGLFVTNAAGAPTIVGSIVADNRGQLVRAGPLVPSNCSGILPTDGRGNLESGTDCSFDDPASRQTPSTGLATALVNDGGTLPVLPITAESPARDLAGPCTSTDLRDVQRPVGGACDAGAYEYVPPPPPAATPTPEAQPPVPTPTPTPTVVPVPTPVAGRVIVAARDRGTVLVKPTGATRYEPLDAAKGIPVGSTIDARKGRVRLTSFPRAGAPPETAVFYAGIFRITQARGITDLKLVEALAACPRGKASSAAKKPKKRRLWGDGKGSFRTSGKYSAATVRGTKWLVEDSCAGTLTRVTQGSVTVRHGKRTIVVRAGKRYLARARR